MSLRVAINGYGRIGRDLHRQILKTEGVDVVAINSRAGADSHAYLLQYDSLYGKCDSEINVVDGGLEIDGKKVAVLQQRDIADINWGAHDVDVVIESTGHYTNFDDAEKHIKSGAKKVLITAPCKDDRIETLVVGVNQTQYDPAEHSVVSNASCTTNCLAPVMKVLEDELGVESAFVTTIHAFTNTQNLLDNSNTDFRRARSTTESFIPTTTGAMKAIGKVIPSLKGKIDGMAVRVPVPTVSMIDLTANVGKSVNVEELNALFSKYAETSMKGVLGVSSDPLVSVDYKGSRFSATVDLLSTRTLGDNFVKVLAWYDNEWGYVSRVLDLLKWIHCRGADNSAEVCSAQLHQ